MHEILISPYSQEDTSCTFVDLVDSRNTEQGISLDAACKMWRTHMLIYKGGPGEGQCYIEQDGVELDPVED